MLYVAGNRSFSPSVLIASLCFSSQLLGGSMDRILFEDVHKEKSTVLNSGNY